MKKGDRVRFIDQEKDKEYGVLTILEVKGDNATLHKPDYDSMVILTVELSELIEV